LQLKGFYEPLNATEASDLKATDKRMSTLSRKIRELSGKYAVEYVGELFNYKTDNYYESELPTEILYFDTICVIDKDKDDDLSTNLDKINLYKEMSNYLYLGRYTHFTINRVKSLGS
jgi:pyoverdine/dityrosine biosynthesis protein Dit1